MKPLTQEAYARELARLVRLLNASERHDNPEQGEIILARLRSLNARAHSSGIVYLAFEYARHLRIREI